MPTPEGVQEPPEPTGRLKTGSLNGAEPTSGPAGRPLPQLPLAIDDQGMLVAQRDFDTPVGPGFWNLP